MTQIDTIPHFEEMYQGQYDTGAEFAEQIATELWLCNKEICLHWVADRLGTLKQKTWDNALSYDYTQIGDLIDHIF